MSVADVSLVVRELCCHHVLIVTSNSRYVLMAKLLNRGIAGPCNTDCGSEGTKHKVNQHRVSSMFDTAYFAIRSLLSDVIVITTIRPRPWV